MTAQSTSVFKIRLCKISLYYALHDIVYNCKQLGPGTRKFLHNLQLQLKGGDFHSQTLRLKKSPSSTRFLAKDKVNVALEPEVCLKQSYIHQFRLCNPVFWTCFLEKCKKINKNAYLDKLLGMRASLLVTCLPSLSSSSISEIEQWTTGTLPGLKGRIIKNKRWFKAREVMGKKLL